MDSLNLFIYFRYIHYENVMLALESMSITEDMTKHKEANIEWLKNEIQEANNIIDQVLQWMDKCEDAMELE